MDLVRNDYRAGLPPGIGDVAADLMALPVAYALVSDTREKRRAAVAWNIFGLVDFTIAVGIGLAIASSVIVPGIANSATGAYPAVLYLRLRCPARSCCTYCRCANCATATASKPEQRLRRALR